ncbi:hypothetical protein [Aurantibacillus circumpalustris]|uniref:hypothetical protein n=1 Tax=Aurantibacillus circumpalustris TaxID=3036359 RepID=UPI00295C31C0|nr:hypothetical protein [Aurantibacillus circumpalustris]
MIRITIISLLIIANSIVAQNPLLKVYVNTKEVSKTEVPVYAFVKANGRYYSILKEKAISLPEEVEYHNIEALKFIVKKDTINFSINKLLEDLKKHPEKNMVDELYSIFKEISKWELRIDNFVYKGKGQLSHSDGNSNNKKETSNDYTLYSLRTTSFKYYVVKG